jgi:AmmeMemoRadiSam system protein B
VKPRLREDLELLLFEQDGQRAVLVRDREGYVPEGAMIEASLLGLLQYFDGTSTLEEMREDLARRGAGFISVADLEAFAESLDGHYMLESDRFRAEQGRRREFLEGPLRAPSHAGAAYPEEPQAARAFLQEKLERAAPAPPGRLRRLIAPHIDLRLGADVYAHAVRRLHAAGRPDVVVVLGVCHAACESPFVACRKDFTTPLGTVSHDGAFLDRLEARVGRALTEGQLVHMDEHSVEFQALWLAHLWPEDPPRIVPFLVRGFHEQVMRRESPASVGEIEAFVAALRETIAEDRRAVLVLASVDLAHQGPLYDHDEGLDEAGERRMEEQDRAILDRVVAGDAEGFFRAIAEDENARQVCGVGPIYLTLRLGEGGGDLLRYGQGRIHPESGSVVSFAAVSFAG